MTDTPLPPPTDDSRRGTLPELLWFALLSVPVHLVVQSDLISTLFEHPTSTLVRTYGVGTLTVHWATWMLALAAACRLLPFARARLPLLVAATCVASVYAQADWISYRNFQVHLIGFIRSGVFAQQDAMTTTGLKPIAFVVPLATAGAACAAFCLLAWLATRRPPPRPLHAPARRPALHLGLAAAVLLADRAAHLLYQRRENQIVSEFTESIPAYLLPPTRAVLELFVPRMQALMQLTERIKEQTLSRQEPRPYPARLDTSPPRKRPHVLFVVYESFRHDAVAGDVMPRLRSFAERSVHCRNHYSNSTATHFGLFSLFYSLNPPSWWQIEAQRLPPLPVKLLRAHGWRTVLVTTGDLGWYAMDDFMFTDAAFDRIDQSRLVAARERERAGTGWQADVEAADDVLAELRDSGQPVFAFLFLNSTHFHYYYPPECAVETPVYDPDAVSTLDFPANRDKVVRRYRNSLRFADRLFGRILDGLDLENTIVVVTGDHGEELGEHGYFFHAGDFVDEQIRVPLALHLPGNPPRAVTRLTSHVDVFPTVLRFLGIEPQSGFEWTGRSVLGSGHPFVLAGAANVHSPMPTRFALIDDHLKLYFRVYAGSLRVTRVSTKDDVRLPVPFAHPHLDDSVGYARRILSENVFR